jgi:hypothetical protein
MEIRCIKQDSKDGEVFFEENVRYSAYVVGVDHLYAINEQNNPHCIARDASHDWENDEYFAEYFRVI